MGKEDSSFSPGESSRLQRLKERTRRFTGVIFKAAVTPQEANGVIGSTILEEIPLDQMTELDPAAIMTMAGVNFLRKQNIPQSTLDALSVIGQEIKISDGGVILDFKPQDP
jgi:hypothetical protein